MALTKLQKVGVGAASTIAAVGVLGYMFYRYALNSYSFTPKGVSIIGGGLKDEYLDLNLTFELKSTIGISFIVKNIDLDVFIQGIKVGHISKEEKIVVPSNGTNIVTVPLYVDLTPIKDNIFSLGMSALSSGLQISIDGFSKCYISGILIGVNVSTNEVFPISGLNLI